MLLLVYVAASIVFLIACYQDIRHRTIPNFLPAAVAVVAVVRWFVLGQLGSALWAVGAAMIVLAVTSFMFVQGWVGGGDVKLLVASVFLLGAAATPAFLLGMALIGGVLALISFARMMPGPPVAADENSRFGMVRTYSVPYGVAIALSAIMILALDYRGGAS